MKKLELLQKIANDFNNENITWNLGASCMLYLRGIVTEFDDIDIMVSVDDIDKVKRIMSKYGTYQAHLPNEKYKTEHFLEYNISGIDVDIMAGFNIVRNHQEHYFPLLKTQEYDIYDLNGVAIKLASVEEWYKYYQLMNRTDKVKLLENYVKMSDL